jgi:hypothetical protein
VYKFLFGLNKDSRTFIQHNFIAVRNGYVNEGLIEYQFDFKYNNYVELEKLYLQTIKRNIANRTLLINLEIEDQSELSMFNEVINWIKE